MARILAAGPGAVNNKTVKNGESSAFMNSSDIYVKTLQGEEAMTQRTRVVQRSQRMVLVLVDGKTRVAELSAKIGDSRLVETALKELEAGGFIALSGESPKEAPKPASRPPMATPSQLSQFSTFGPKPVRPAVSSSAETVMPSNFSTFGRPMPPRPGPAAPAEPGAGRREAVPEPEEDKPVRRSLPMLRIIGGALVLGVLAVAGAALFYPYGNHQPALEASLSRQLGVPVRVGEVAPRFLPAPALELSRVRLGRDGEGQVDSVLLPGLWTHVRGREPDRTEVIHIQGGRLPVEALSRWLMRPDASGPLKVGVRHLELLVAGSSLGALSGEIQRGTDGRLQLASLQTDDRGLRLELKPRGRELEVQLEASSWKPLPGFPVSFSHAMAQGVLQNASLRLESVDLRFLDGRYEGDLLIDWGTAPGVAGSGSLHHLNAAGLAALWGAQASISGGLSGSLRFRAGGSDPGQLMASLEAEGDWRIERGEMRGVDLANAIRLGRGQISRGGSTRFERLSTHLRLSPAGVQFGNLLLEAGMMQARGQVEVDSAGVFQGRLGVDLSRSSGAATTVQLNGRLPGLEATVQ